jgi:hypothetical protein
MWIGTLRPSIVRMTIGRPQAHPFAVQTMAQYSLVSGG